MIDRTSELGGNDQHGELRVGYKPSGQSGVSSFSYLIQKFALLRYYLTIMIFPFSV